MLVLQHKTLYPYGSRCLLDSRDYIRLNVVVTETTRRSPVSYGRRYLDPRPHTYTFFDTLILRLQNSLIERHRHRDYSLYTREYLVDTSVARNTFTCVLISGHWARGSNSHLDVISSSLKTQTPHLRTLYWCLTPGSCVRLHLVGTSDQDSIPVRTSLVPKSHTPVTTLPTVLSQKKYPPTTLR